VLFAPELADPFIATIARMKHSVAPVVCLEANEERATVREVRGSSLFISKSGEFLTAAHVVQWMADNPHACPITALLPVPDLQLCPGRETRYGAVPAGSRSIDAERVHLRRHPSET
jgi:hypothetical protein